MKIHQDERTWCGVGPVVSFRAGVRLRFGRKAHLWHLVVCDLLEVVEADDRAVAGDHAH